MHKHNRTEMRTVESFDKHSVLLPFFWLNLTEENKKQEHCRQHSGMSLIKYQNQYPKIWIILKEIKLYPKSGNSLKRYPKIREQPKKVPKIMAHSRITTYVSPPPPPPPPRLRISKYGPSNLVSKSLLLTDQGLNNFSSFHYWIPT